ncbi:MAG: hypothetical protein R3301_08300 [Saprospiraceae bacterium]|nr:hypothetical protein [Saprospiraceae bacterium]
MKYPLYILTLCAATLMGCAKDDVAVQPNTPTLLNPDMAYLNINVATENEAAQNGGCLGNERCVFTVEDALVVIYVKDGDRHPPETAVVAEGRTNAKGNVDFPELPLATYMVDVVSDYGATTVTVVPAKGYYTNVLVRL